jgi:hypothetical protein
MAHGRSGDSSKRERTDRRSYGLEILTGSERPSPWPRGRPWPRRTPGGRGRF